MSGPERHRRANHLHPARQPRNGRDAQRELKHRLDAAGVIDPVLRDAASKAVARWTACGGA